MFLLFLMINTVFHSIIATELHMFHSEHFVDINFKKEKTFMRNCEGCQRSHWIFLPFRLNFSDTIIHFHCVSHT